MFASIYSESTLKTHAHTVDFYLPLNCKWVCFLLLFSGNQTFTCLRKAVSLLLYAYCFFVFLLFFIPRNRAALFRGGCTCHINLIKDHLSEKDVNIQHNLG